MFIVLCRNLAPRTSQPVCISTRRGNNFSLSSEERAGVRTSVTPYYGFRGENLLYFQNRLSSPIRFLQSMFVVECFSHALPPPSSIIAFFSVFIRVHPWLKENKMSDFTNRRRYAQ